MNNLVYKKTLSKCIDIYFHQIYLTIIPLIHKLHQLRWRNIILLVNKAKSNFKVAEYAERNRHYDAAVSRYYYYLYEYFLNFLGITKPELVTGNHSLDLNNATDYIKENLCKNRNEKYIITRMKFLKSQRIESDYYDIRIENSTEFANRFKTRFDKINELLIDKGVINV